MMMPLSDEMKKRLDLSFKLLLNDLVVLMTFYEMRLNEFLHLNAPFPEQQPNDSSCLQMIFLIDLTLPS